MRNLDDCAAAPKHIRAADGTLRGALDTALDSSKRGAPGGARVKAGAAR